VACWKVRITDDCHVFDYVTCEVIELNRCGLNSQVFAFYFFISVGKIAEKLSNVITQIIKSPSKDIRHVL